MECIESASASETPPAAPGGAASEGPIGFWAVAEAYPERLAVVEASGRSVSYGELADLTNRYAHLLAEMGGHLVLVLPNGIEHVALGLAAYQAGVRWTPVSWRSTPTELAHVLADSGASVLAAHERASAAFEASQTQASVPHKLQVGGAPNSEHARALAEGWKSLGELACAQPSTRPERPRTGSAMFYTSGTTGKPKGVRRRLPDRHPDESAERSVRLLRFFGIEPHGDNVHLCVAPLHHAAAGVWVNLSLHMGHGVVLMDGWEEIGALELIESRRVTQTHMVPTMFARLLRLPEKIRSSYDLSSLRWVVHAAAPCPVEVKRRMLDWWGDCIYEYYAATEGGGTLVGPKEWRQYPGTVGKPWPGSEVIVASPEGRRLAAGEVGTVYMRQARSAPFEYHNDPPETPPGGLKGFFSVGDMGYFNEDGYLYLVDRAADVIIVGGVNVYPAEVEAALAECPLVADAAVFGIPSEDLGEEIKAVVRPSEGVEAGEDARGRILAFLGGRISSRSHPHSLDFAEYLPRDDAGKLNRRSLRDPYWSDRPRCI